ncbi:SAM-dependent methyltransferase [Kribbella sp. NPDC056861]|uniref:SAM-dependent methyltransferase n=1 Tax=Kribbella sp. NPDC056861 TaxID=3154857 RepID=UPI003428E422
MTTDDEARPNVARMYDYWLGGVCNLPIDRAHAARVEEILPGMEMLVRFNRGFLRQAVTFMFDQGIRQFLDLGSGLPTATNTHHLALGRQPPIKVVYVDHDPAAVECGEQLLRAVEDVKMICADARRPDDVFAHPVVRELLDLREPLALLMNGLLVFVGDEEDPGGLVTQYRERCAVGSYFAVSHLSDELADPQTAVAMHAMVDSYRGTVGQLHLRDRAAVEALLKGLTPVAPGLVTMPSWRPDADLRFGPSSSADTLGYSVVARLE